MTTDVTATREEYDQAMSWRWPLVRDVCSGSEAVKAKKATYLPVPSEATSASYANYIQRAKFLNATSRTRNGLVGAVFRTAPTLTTPAALDYVKQDVDGSGSSIYQQSQAVLSDILETGREFLLVDYPAVDGSTSRADQQSGRIRATISRYPAEAITNWWDERVGSENRTTLVVLKETRETRDGYVIRKESQYRVLAIVDGRYVVTVLRQNTGEKAVAWEVVEAYYPRRSSGVQWDRITGTFVGSQNNDSSIDEAPLYDLAEANISHYQTSADSRESTYLMGQAMLVISGVDEHWAKEFFKDGITVGSRAPIVLPAQSDAKLLQTSGNTQAERQLEVDLNDLAVIGARLMEKGAAVKTATEAAADNAAEHSVLSLVASNVSEAYTLCLSYMAEYEGVSAASEYKLSQDFVEATLDPQMLAALVAAWQANALTQSDLFRLLRKFDLVDPEKTDEELRDELEANPSGLNLDDENGNVSATG